MSENTEGFVEEGGVTGLEDDGPNDYPEDDGAGQETGVKFDPNDTEFPGLDPEADPEETEDNPDDAEPAPNPDGAEG